MSTATAASQLNYLVEHMSDKSISLIMPTHQSGRQVQQNPIRFKNLVSQVVARLVEQGESETEAEKCVKPLRDLQRDNVFWQHQTAGLAVYLADDELTTIGLHEGPAETVLVGERFYILPVAIDAARRQVFRVLAVTWEDAQVLRASRAEVEVEETDLFPVNIREIILPPDAEEQLQFRSQGTAAGRTMFHGQGEGEEVIESDRQRFLSEVGKRIEDLENQQALPLIFVGTAEVRGEFAANSKVDVLRNVEASPAGLSDQELTSRVLEVANGSLVSAEQSQEKLGSAIANGKASCDLQEVLAAAESGRVKTLLINSDILDQGTTETESTRTYVNQAVFGTLQAGGDVMAYPADVLKSSPIAATYRY